MRNRSRILVGAASLAVAIGSSTIAISPVPAMGARFAAAGHVHCSVAGKARFAPGVTTTARSGVRWKVTASLNCSTGTTGDPGVTVRSGKLKVTGSPSTRDCSTTSMPAAGAEVRWKAIGGKVEPSHVLWSRGDAGTSGSRLVADYPGGGATSVSGSYSGANAVAHLVSETVSLVPCFSNAGFKRYLVDGAASALDLTGGTGPSTACGNGQPAPAAYQSVVVFSFENRTWSGVGGVGYGTAMPYLHALAQSCSFFTSWTETNPSQNSLTQYGGQVTGAFQPGMVNDCSPSATCSTTADNIFRQARAAGKTAINYVEGATAGCSASGNAAKHIPSLYMWGADDRSFCSAQTRPYSEFNPANPPAFAFITPTQCNDGHDCSNSTVDAWARAHIQPVLDSARYRAGNVAVFVWYDEDHPVPNLQIAPTAHHGPFGTAGIGYASTLKAWESMLGFPCLANACTAPDLRSVAGI